jgi:signal transduction histidine kinase/DNA-binding response OmpR family regulator
MLIWWGSELAMLYNDAYATILGNKHPHALGRPGIDVWGEIWDVVGPMLRGVASSGEASWSEDQLLVMNRKGFMEETYFTWSYSPIADETGIGGIFTAVFETTERVLSERRLVTLQRLNEQVSRANEIVATCEASLAALGACSRDVPFALLYLLDADGKGARLAAHAGIAPGLRASPPHVALDKSPWPFAEVLETREMALVRDVEERFGNLRGSDWPEAIHHATVQALQSSVSHQPYGFLVIGASPRLDLDAPYRNFMGLACNHIASALASATAYAEERRRAEALAEIDRAKTAFFSNVSHEFRTPLTLMLGPLEDAMAGGALSGESLAVAHRNALRLLKLVNALLDFSRLEAGRADASFEPTDLATLTRELAAAFEPAFKAAGVELEVVCPPLHEPVYVDPTMWEKVVLNLISNAFKFTFEGKVRVALMQEGDSVELVVRDTGTGVPAEEVPRLFERFHRVAGAKSRTNEGSGIGLALVHELVRIHGGTIKAASTLGRGTTFTVQLPLGFAHLPADRIRAKSEHVSSRANVFVEEAQRWVPQVERDAPAAATARARIIVVDDNADMREYVGRVLGDRWGVELAADGEAGLEMARKQPPDLIISDIMMPGLDGLGLLRALREDPRTEHIPVIFLSARAGDEAKSAGIEAGADDYVVKPFAARELIARVNTQLELAGLRADTHAIHRISSEMTRELDLQKLLQLITDEATRVVKAEFGAFFYNVENAQGESYMLYTLSGVPREAFAKFPMPRNTDVFAPTFKGEGVLRLDDVKKDPRYGHMAPHYGMPEGHLPVTSYLAAPVVTRAGEVLGGLFFGHSKPAMFTERHERMLVGIAAQGAVAIDNARLYDKVRVLLERERDARASAESASRAKDEFLAILGHELRNPLAPIQTALQLMALRNDPASKEREVIQRQVDHVVRLVDDLLDVSRITRGKLELSRQRIEVALVVAQALEMASPLIEQKQHRLQLSASPTGHEVDVDPARMAQVLSNLLTNAAKYTPSGGDIAVSVAREGDDEVIRVSDTGIGLAADQIAKMFEPFVQDPQSLDRSRGGLGLGLAIVKNLVERHGGSVHATSGGPGRGSEFIVRLPALHPAPVVDVPADAKTSSSVKGHGRTILVVDDNIDAAQMVVDTLQMLGHEATAAYDGPSALGMVTRVKPDVALLDIGLPVMDGYELARRLRDMPELRGVRLIALTGYGQDSDRARSLAAGFDDHLVKPLRLELLEEILERSNNNSN